MMDGEWDVEATTHLGQQLLLGLSLHRLLGRRLCVLLDGGVTAGSGGGGGGGGGSGGGSGSRVHAGAHHLPPAQG
jgi:hypothetical protein